MLIVEPADSVRRTMTRVLARAFEITPLASAASAIERVKEEPFAAAIVDLALGHMSVVTLILALRDGAPELPLVLTAAAPSPDGERAAREHAGVTFLPKPYDTPQLRAAVEGALSSARPKSAG